MLELADRTGFTFTWQRWKAGGGPNNEALGGYIFAAPDNLSFDKAGNMWVVSDISSTRLNSDSWRGQRHALVERDGTARQHLAASRASSSVGVLSPLSGAE